MKRRVAITGLGALAPNGNSTEEMWNSMINGVNGIGKVSLIDMSDGQVSVAGEVKNFDPLDHIDKKLARRMDRFWG